MSAPPLRRSRLRGRCGGTYRRWWSHRRGNGAGHEHREHQPTRHERQNQHPNGKPVAAGFPLERAWQSRRISASRLALAGISSVIDARTGDGSRRVRSAFCIRANAEATNADGCSNAGLGEVEPEWSKFEALTKSPSHDPPSVLQRAAQAESMKDWRNRLKMRKPLVSCRGACAARERGCANP